MARAAVASPSALLTPPRSPSVSLRSLSPSSSSSPSSPTEAAMSKILGSSMPRPTEGGSPRRAQRAAWALPSMAAPPPLSAHEGSSSSPSSDEFAPVPGRTVNPATPIRPIAPAAKGTLSYSTVRSATQDRPSPTLSPEWVDTATEAADQDDDCDAPSPAEDSTTGACVRARFVASYATDVSSACERHTSVHGGCTATGHMARAARRSCPRRQSRLGLTTRADSSTSPPSLRRLTGSSIGMSYSSQYLRRSAPEARYRVGTRCKQLLRMGLERMEWAHCAACDRPPPRNVCAPALRVDDWAEGAGEGGGDAAAEDVGRGGGCAVAVVVMAKQLNCCCLVAKERWDHSHMAPNQRAQARRVNPPSA